MADTASDVPRLVRQHLTVATEATGRQMLAWRNYLDRILDVPISRTQVAHGFRGEIDSYTLADMRYLESRTDPVSQARTAARISTDKIDDYVFHVTVNGIAETVTGSQRKSAQFVPGILFLDMAQPMIMRRPTPSHVQAFFLPRAIVDSLLPGAEALHGSVIGCNTPLARLLYEHLLTLRHDLSTMADADAEQAIAAGVTLALAVFGRVTRLGQSVRAAAREAMLGRVKRHIRANLGSRDLMPEQILRGFPLARPTLYRMFEPEGGLHAYIRNCRLREAADRLLRTRTLPIARIADDLGFSHPADFTRAFRRAYGVAPQEFRAMEPDWLCD